MRVRCVGIWVATTTAVVGFATMGTVLASRDGGLVALPESARLSAMIVREALGPSEAAKSLGKPRCPVSELRFGLYHNFGRAMSQDGVLFSFENLSASVCTLEGYPSVQVYSKGGEAMLTRLVHGGGMFFSDPGACVVVIRPRHEGLFGFSWPSTDQPKVDQTGCVKEATVRSTLPSESGSLKLKLDFNSREFTPVCKGVGGVTAIAPASSFPF